MMFRSLATALLIGTSGQTALAATFDDGLVNVFNGALNEPAFVQNDTTLSIGPGGAIQPQSSSNSFVSAVDVRDTSNVTLNGGAIQGGTLNRRSGIAGNGVLNRGTGAVEIFDGIVIGGEKIGGSGIAGEGVRTSGGSFRMTGGTVVGGFNSGTSGLSGSGLRLQDTSANISGGTITGGGSNGVTLAGFAVRLLGSSQATISGGILQGGLRNGSRSLSLFVDGTARVTVTGGRFDGLISLAGRSVTRVEGSDLSYDAATRLLTGTLLSGEAISVRVNIGEEAQLILPTIPVPAMLPAFWVGLLGLWCMRRKRLTA